MIAGGHVSSAAAPGGGYPPTSQIVGQGPTVTIGTNLTGLDTLQYYHTDAIGSVRLITDAVGQVISTKNYLPFGNEWAPDSGAPTGDVVRFAGKERDPESTLNYFGARYFSDAIGRFISVDPALDVEHALANPQQLNRYAYVLNNPFKFTDPDGRNPFLVGGGIGVAVYTAWNAYVNI